MKKRLYVAGPMSSAASMGYNYEKFHVAAAALRAAGFEVENPAENEEPEGGAWRDWMKLAINQVLSVDGVATLPNWMESRGASLEVHIAQALGISVAPVDTWLEGAR